MSQNQEVTAQIHHLTGPEDITQSAELLGVVLAAYPEAGDEAILAYLENFGNAAQLASALSRIVRKEVHGEEGLDTYQSDAEFYDDFDVLGDGIHTFGRLDASEERYDIYTKISIPRTADEGTLGLMLAKAVSFTTAQQVTQLEVSVLEAKGASDEKIQEVLDNRDKALDTIKELSLQDLAEKGAELNV